MANANTITRGQFWGTALVCAVVLTSANLVVARLTRQTVSRRILADAVNSGAAQTIALGNSLVRSGFNAEEFAAAQQSSGVQSAALNMAMGASTPAEHLLLLRAALRADDHARVLLYGFYDFQLTEPVLFTFGDMIGNHDLLYYDEPEFARRYYSMSRYDVAGFEITRHLPLLAERGAVWAKVEQLRRAISQQGMPKQATNQFGRVADFTLLEADSQDEFVKHCQRASNEQLNAPVLEIIREAQERQLRVVFVLMPLPPKHVQTFYETRAWQEYQRHLHELLAKQNVVAVDASHWFPDAHKFGDALHLNEEGAKEFSQRFGALCGNVHPSNLCSGVRAYK
jgi:hypothetical protein